jgi:type II secretory pathway component GspD/PulD (secretin)
MKTSISLSLATVFAAALIASAAAQTASDQTTAGDNNATNEPEQTTTAPDAPTNDAAMPDQAASPDAPSMPMDDNSANPPTVSAQSNLSQPSAALASTTTPDSAPMAFVPPQAAGTNADSLLLNFRNAPLDMVLNYLSDAAGFIIVLDTPVHGNVSVISSHPMTRDEAVDLLNSVLNKNGYAAIRDGRTLTIVDKDDAKTRDIPVKVSNDPDTIPKNAEIVTEIIPIRFVEARQLVSDLSSFVSPQATIVANEEGNSIVITDTQSNIRHLAEIIKAVDSSAEAETEIRVFRLKYANPTDVATLLGGIFPSSTSGSGTQSPIRFGGGGGAGGGGPGGFFARMMAAQGGAAGGGSGSQNQRVQKAQQVIAVADLRTSSVVVTAAKDLMAEIDDMIRELDVNSSRDQKVYVFHVDNADPQQALQVLQTMFPSTSTSSSRNSSSSSSQNSALMTREQNNATSTGSSSSSSSTSSGIGGAGGRSGGGGLY